MWGAVVKETRAPSAAPFVVLRRYRADLVDADATRFLRKAATTAIAKLESDTDETNGRNNLRQLRLSLLLRGFAIASRCGRSGGISGRVAGL